MKVDINIIELTDECFGGYGMGDQYMYIYPSCNYENIIEEFKFCPNCGIKLSWLFNENEEEDLFTMKITEMKLPEIGYNSHGFWSTLQRIYEIEEERGNSTFKNIDKDFLSSNLDTLSIWITKNPLNAFKYSISASESNLEDSELIKKYPDYENHVFKILTENCICIAFDDDDGYLIMVK